MGAVTQATPVKKGGELPWVGSRIGGEVEIDVGTSSSFVYDPATGEATKRVSHADAAAVDRTVKVAQRAWEQDWAEAAQNRRFAVLLRLRELIVENRAAFVDAIVDEGGKSLADAEGEMNRALDGLESAFSMPVSLQGTYGEQVARGIDVYSLPRPLGVVATITPFNFPVMIPLWDAAAALACGNSVIHKPSPRVPSAAGLLGELIDQAGVPAGVYNVLHGHAGTVDALLDHPGIAAASFVGSTPVAKHIYERGSAAGKRVQAMGGAKNHVVVMPDADLAFTADSLVSGAFGSTGQRCMAATIAVAVGDVADSLKEAIVARIADVRTGPGRDPGTAMGPLITAESQARVLDLIGRGISEGAEIVVDGRPIAEELPGFFVGPTLLDRVRTGMSVYDEEIFGPVLGIVRVGDLDEAIKLVSENPYGNGASIFTASGAVGRRFQRDATAGMIGINVPIPVPVNSFSTGGWKASVFGSHGLLGPEAFRFYTHQKVVTARWPETVESNVNLAFNPGR
jgi:malonate-semialdehyde dehydrogenase (acetylating) / methylmalonate-semialdehyde dehydrogenase